MRRAGRAARLPTLTAQDRHLLSLLAAGLPDQAISRQMEISYRTLQRRIRDLMSRLDVQTRFQLGVQAVRGGWLATSDAKA